MREKEFHAYFDLKPEDTTKSVLTINIVDYLVTLSHYNRGSMMVTIHGMGVNECTDLIAACQSRLDYLAKGVNDGK